MTKRKSYNNTSEDFDWDDELESEELQLQIESGNRIPDDVAGNVSITTTMQHLMDTITRIGGEVSRMRAEVDGLLEQNANLVSIFEKLRDVIVEKQHVNLDDFELACEVLEAPGGQLKMKAVRKIAH